MKKALICGISGQDGAYLAQFLLGQGYAVCGTSRDVQMASFQNLARLGVLEQVQLISMAPNDFRSVLQALNRFEPDEIYNLAGQSSVGLSFEQPVETLESVGLGTLNLLEAVRFLGRPSKIYNAASSECFGDTAGQPADENTPFRPRSPYGVAKAAAFWEVANYREAYNLFACSGLLFNHESPLRPERFVTQKIVAAARRIAAGSREKLPLGNLQVRRDWGWAPEYVRAMYLMLQQDEPDDYVVATGQAHSLEEFAAAAFAELDLDWREHCAFDETLLRPTDIGAGLGNPAKAKRILGWEARYTMPDVVRAMVRARTTGNAESHCLASTPDALAGPRWAAN
jgi:GDPmannose 4,6-dehydratase